MLRPRAVTPPPSPRKIASWLFLPLLLVAVTGVFTYARFRNAAARDRVDTACKTLRDAEEGQARAVGNVAKLSPSKGDSEKLATIEKATRASRVCEPLHDQLSGYSWNFGRRWSAPPVDAAAMPSRDEIVAISARMRPRCISQMGMFLDIPQSDGSGPSAAKRQELLDLCDLEKQSAKAITSDGATRPLRLLDEWPAEIERMARAVAPTPQPASSSLE